MTILEEHGMFRNKPTVGSVCGGMCRALPLAKITPSNQKFVFLTNMVFTELSPIFHLTYIVNVILYIL